MTLSTQAAKNLIAELKARDLALGRSPDNWYTYENHVYGAANVAKTIAAKTGEINPQQAYVCALLHDISRTEERRLQRFHGILGFEKLADKDEKAARSALLHMFPWNQIPPYEKCSASFFDNKKDYAFVADYAKNTKVSDFDLLIQLSDCLANKNGIVTLEQRAKEFAERRGIVLPEEEKQSRLHLKTYFDRKIGGNVYNLFLPAVSRNRER